MSEYYEKVESYEELEVWKHSMDVAENAYRITQGFPKEEVFGLISQIRRAASSVPFNIAEGWGRGIGAANINCCRIARGSVCELRTAFQLAQRLRYGDSEDITSILSDTVKLRKLIHKYITGMEKNLVREPIASYGNGTPE